MDGNQESLNISLNLDESRSPQKDLLELWLGFFCRMETDFQGVGCKTKSSAGVEFLLQQRGGCCWKIVFKDAWLERSHLAETQRKRQLEWVGSHVKWPAQK